MAISLDEARAKLKDSQWTPVESVGEGGGGTVFLCANTELVKDLNNVGWRIVQATLSRIEDRRSGHQGPQFMDDKAVFPSFLGHVLRAARTHDDISAVKIPSSAAKDATDSLRFKREIEAMQRHEHPALIRLFDHDTKEPPAWFAMEYHPRGDLELEANRSQYLGNPLAVLRDIRPIADGLGLIHRNGVVHRDVKPKNIFVGDDGQLVLGDFGIVLPGDDATRMTGAPIVSRDWVPDWVRFDSLAAYTPIVDVFMLARVVYFLISGEKVMASQVDKALASLSTKYPTSRGLNATFSLLRKCLVLNEEDCGVRDGATLTREIDQVLASEAIGPQARLLFSFLSTDLPTSHAFPQKATRIGGPLPPLAGLDGHPVLVEPSTRECVARARYFGFGGSVEFLLGGNRSDRADLSPAGLTHPGTWSEPIYLRAAIPSGWHNLSIGGLSALSHLSGFVLYGR